MATASEINHETAFHPSVILAGMESAGKSALFRCLTGEASGDEANFRGSTIRCRSYYSTRYSCEVVDTPGLRSEGDAETTRIALAELNKSDRVLLVVRGTDLQHELETLLREINFTGKRLAIAVTFSDKNPAEIKRLASHYRLTLGVPVVALDARSLNLDQRADILEAIDGACIPDRVFAPPPRPGWSLVPKATLLEHPALGPFISILVLALLWALPVVAAFRLASFLQPVVDEVLIRPTVSWLNQTLPPLLSYLLTGSYGILTLGWYSFLWAFPVVLFLAISTAIVEQSGLQDRIMRSLDPLLRPFGLVGRDLLPILTGFGCNVVAVQQSRACSRCTRRSCVSMISFGSACSYQIGATLSVLGASGHGSLFAPYLGLIFIVGLIHTRIWNGSSASPIILESRERSFLHLPRPRAVWWKIKSVLRQFLFQAMPIFLLICLIGAVLEYTGFLTWLARVFSPVLGFFHLPPQVAPAVVFSILRKDGLLTINQGEGSLAASLTAGQAFTLVWLAGTLTACLVTLWAVRLELGWRTALIFAGRQALTSIAVAFTLGAILS